MLPRDLLKKWPGEVLRWALLSAHYRQPLEWTEALLEQSKRQLDKFYRLLAEAPRGDAANREISPATPNPPQSIVLALDDDLNTPKAFAGLHELRDIAVQIESGAKARAVANLKAAGNLLGFFSADPGAWFKQKNVVADAGAGEVLIEGKKPYVWVGAIPESIVDALIADRAIAKKSKDYKKADHIREALAKEGVVLEDSAGGTTWRRA